MPLSILEFGVYGLIAYSSMLMLIISTIKEIPDTKKGSITRAFFLIPGAVCAWILAVAAEVIITADTTNTIVSLNTTEAWTETISSSITLENPIWITVHFMFFIIMIFYVLYQIVNMLTKDI